MKTEIKKKVRAGKRLSNAQIAYIREKLLPNYETGCHYCRYNLMISVGLDPLSKTRR